MTENATIYQCPECLRLFNAGGDWLPHPLRAFVPESAVCGAADCAGVAGELRQKERERTAQRLARRQSCRRSEVKGQRAEVSRAVRSPVKDNEEDTRRMANVGEVKAPAGVTAREFSQEDFVASGAAEKSNQAIIEFFEKPKNFDLWFPAKMLVNIVMKQQSLHMNNRAVDVRPHFLKRGLYLDNYMIAPQEFAGKVSCYRLCRIADALSLSHAEKEALLGNAESSHAGPVTPGLG